MCIILLRVSHQRRTKFTYNQFHVHRKSRTVWYSRSYGIGPTLTVNAYLTSNATLRFSTLGPYQVQRRTYRYLPLNYLEYGTIEGVHRDASLDGTNKRSK